MAHKRRTKRGEFFKFRLDTLSQMVLKAWQRDGVNPSEKIRSYVKRHALPANTPAKERVAFYTFLKRELAKELEDRRKALEEEYAREFDVIDRQLREAKENKEA